MSYNAADITELGDVQHRLRPAVNLSLDVLNTALRELVDNAVEEVADPSHGGTSTVTITLHADGSVGVAERRTRPSHRLRPRDRQERHRQDPRDGARRWQVLGPHRRHQHRCRPERHRRHGHGVHLGPHRRHGAPRRQDVPAELRPATPAFEGKEFDPNAEFTRADNQKLRGTGNRKPDAHGTTVRILFDQAVVPDASVDIAEVLLRAHAAARMCPGVHLTVDEAGPARRSRPRCCSPSTAPGAPKRCWTSCAPRRAPHRAPVRAVVDGEYTTGRGPTPFRWSLTAARPSRPPWPRSATPCAPPAAAHT